MITTILSAVGATVTILLAIGRLYATLNRRIEGLDRRISDVSERLDRRISDVLERLARIEGRMTPWFLPQKPDTPA